jgi:glyoxylase-like metal-dependent hydrolase (beta-lactamase superfamily II)
MTELRYEVLVNDGVRRNRPQRLPDGSPIVSSPLATTLILGEHDAVLVDVPFTRKQVARVGDWVESFGKRLAYIYATHGHGDHWFGTDLLLQRFPGAIAYATEGTIRLMHKQATAGRAELWDLDFPGLIPDSPVVYRPIPAEGFELEGHRLVAIETGHTDTDDTTVLHVPSIGLVVAGDVAYNGVHQYLLESAEGGIEAWLNAIDKVAALSPGAVVAGHKNKDLPDDPVILEQTRDYLLDAQRLLADKPSPRQFYEQMIALYPDRLNAGPVWYGAAGLLSWSPQINRGSRETR